MSIYKIVKYGDPVLRKKTQDIKEVNEDIKKLALDMLETMYAAPGVGLAAPQVGISLKICVIDIMPNGKKEPYVLINPKIIDGKDTVELEEGCLSFPKIYEKVKRFNEVTAEYLDINGKQRKITVDGFLAKAFQHEIDHLNGKVFIDLLSPWKRKNVEKEIRKRKKDRTW
jgi:peptide deformylase